MYRPPAFDVTDIGELQTAIEAAGPAHLVSLTDDGLVGSLVPMLLDRSAGRHGALVGHLARANRHWRAASRDVESMAIFAGPDAYVSPSWYATKYQSGKVVPTWNYEVVHVYGELLVHDDPVWLEALVRRLTDHHESARDDPWSVDDAPGDFVQGQLRAIVGIELEISRIEGNRKLSQNRSDDDRAGVVRGLSNGTSRERQVAARMT
ncbi:MAG: FMN-binding negative transcriptional regulator [Acidimicrobiia bacterium]|nr:FMN-binding negative transcriptional regulator [Acidimicrobiia bacterium]